MPKPKRSLWLFIPLLALALALPAAAQWAGFITGQVNVPNPGLRPVRGIQVFIHNGKIELSLRDFLRLTLANDPSIQITRLSPDTAFASVFRAKSPFDPNLSLSYGATRSITPEFVQTSGASRLNELNQTSGINFSQLLPTGETIAAGFNADRVATNNQYAFFNPTISSGLNLSITQPLWQNRDNLLYRAPLEQAEIGVAIAKDQSATQVATLLAQAADAYWAAAGALGNVGVQQAALKLAQGSYDLNREMLHLGALAKLDIYQSEAQVAADKVQLVQAQYAYKESLDVLRRYIGADLTARLRALPIVLEQAATSGGMGRVMTSARETRAIAFALAQRPEMHAIQRQLASDRLGIAAAHESLEPSLNLTGFYGGNGLGGNQVGGGGATGGLGTALRQMWAFSAPTYGFSLKLGLPLRNSSGAGQLTNALVTRTQDRYVARSDRQAVIESVRLAAKQREMARQQILAARIAVHLAQKNVAAEQEKYKLGSITMFEVLQAQVLLSQDQSSLLSAHINYQQARIAYLLATWKLFPAMGIKLKS